jgi:PAS domain S-box-containing protein
VLQDDEVKFFNKEMLDLLQIRNKKEADGYFLDYVHPDDINDVMVNNENTILIKQRDKHYRIRLLRADKSILWVEIKPVVVEWEEKPAILAFIRDVSRQKNIEDELRQAQKMEAIGTLAGGITHDFNNILASIIGSSELALMDLGDGDVDVKEAFELIRESGHRARDLVKQILSVTRKKSSINFQPINIKEVVSEAMKLIKSTFPSNIKIIEEFGNDLKYISANPTQIHQIIMNLCTNAMHAMETDDIGALKISLCNVNIDGESAGNTLNIEPGAYIELKVTDTGHGIESEVLTRIFDPYFTTKQQGKGTGFGLATCAGIVKSHHGHIRVESSIDKGSAFYLYFPVIDEQSRNDQKALENKKLIQGKGNILFVDDEQKIVNLCQKMLTGAGYSVITALSGQDALGYLKVGKVRIDLMITDMAMPGMTGRKLINEVFKIKPGLPVILCTGYSENMNKEVAEKIGVTAYIEKPYELIDLSFAVKKALAKT